MSIEELRNYAAVEIMGWESCFIEAGDGIESDSSERWDYFENGKYIHDSHTWQPDTDLNHLREVYLAAEKAYKQAYPFLSFAAKFKVAVDSLFTDMTEHPAVGMELATMWAYHPELVLRAIVEAHKEGK